METFTKKNVQAGRKKVAGEMHHIYHAVCTRLTNLVQFVPFSTTVELH